nr:DUF1611 domain-containing protein [Sphingomonas sp. Y57]
MNRHDLAKPYVLFIGDVEHPAYAKTAFGLRDWVPEACVGQLRLSDRAVDIGLPDMTLAQAVEAGAKTLVIAIAPMGGQLDPDWLETITAALDVGLDVAAGLHERLAEIPEIAEASRRSGSRVHDVRQTDMALKVGTGARRTGRRLLTVGTDCALGKKYTALAIAAEMRRRGIDADFRATGQTGILIAGQGLAIDHVVADFISGAAEALSPAGAPDHWDVIEGQGSLFHPAYAGVTLGLVHGSQPDAMVLCHDPGRESLLGLPHMPLPALHDAILAYEAAGRLTNREARVVGIALNTSSLAAADARSLIEALSLTYGMPCCDPVRFGIGRLVDAIERTGRQ